MNPVFLTHLKSLADPIVVGASRASQTEPVRSEETHRDTPILLELRAVRVEETAYSWTVPDVTDLQVIILLQDRNHLLPSLGIRHYLPLPPLGIKHIIFPKLLPERIGSSPEGVMLE